MAHSFLKDLLSVPRHSSLLLKIDDVTNGLSKNINHKIKNTSGNISLMPFKLGTSNVRQVKYKMIPSMMLPWQRSGLQDLFVKNQISPFLTR